VFHHIK